MPWHPENLIAGQRYLFIYMDGTKQREEFGTFRAIELIDSQLCLRYSRHRWGVVAPWTVDVRNISDVREAK